MNEKTGKTSVVEPTMQGLEQLVMLRIYCDYVEEHLHNVAEAWVILQTALKNEKQIWNDHDFWYIHNMIQNHDLSKMDAAEFVQYAEWFFGTYGSNYDLIDDGGKGQKTHVSARAAFSEAWEHHKTCNPHHWQNWTKTAEQFPGEASCHVICMVADWIAMGMKFGDTAEEYYEREKDKIRLPEWAVEFLHRIFKLLPEGV